MDSCELVALVTSTACLLAKNCSDEELTVMAAVFTQLGDTLGTILAHKEVCCPDSKEKSGDT
jgi:hypothetical protein